MSWLHGGEGSAQGWDRCAVGTGYDPYYLHAFVLGHIWSFILHRSPLTADEKSPLLVVRDLACLESFEKIINMTRVPRFLLKNEDRYVITTDHSKINTRPF